MAGSFALEVVDVLFCLRVVEVVPLLSDAVEPPPKSTSLSADLPFAAEEVLCSFSLPEPDFLSELFLLFSAVPDTSESFAAAEFSSSKSCCVEEAAVSDEACSVPAVLCEHATKSIAAKTTAATQIIYFFIELR